MKKIWFSFFCIIYLGASYAQDTADCYFDEQLQLTSKKNASYNGRLIQQDGKWESFAYYSNGTILFHGFFKDKKLTEKEGEYTLYFPNGVRRVATYFDDNKIDSVFTSWYANGDKSDSGLMRSNIKEGLNNCAGGCAALWPVFYAGDNLTQDGLGAGLDIADFGTVTITGGQKQTTYKSWPLYYYAPAVSGTNVRESPGETLGEGFGNVWYVAKPDYSIMLVNAQLVGSDGKSYKSDLTEGTGKTLYFSDPVGVSLYGFSKDSANLNKFTKPDFSNNSVWPIYETDKMVVPSTLDKSLFGTTAVYGKTQLTYKGWPLYYFGADSLKRGLNKGISFPAVGVWPIMVKDAPAAPLP